MTEPLSSDEFLHYHRDGIKNLEIQNMRLDKAAQLTNLGPLDSDLTSTLRKIIERMAASQVRGPDEVFKAAIEGLEVVDSKRFILENLLEAIKRSKGNENINSILKRYQNLGLLPETSPAQTQVPLPQKIVMPIKDRKNIWKCVGIAVAQIGVNAFKSIPKWVEIEPQFTVFPIPSLSFAIKGNGINVHELFETLLEGVSEKIEAS